MWSDVFASDADHTRVEPLDQHEVEPLVPLNVSNGGVNDWSTPSNVARDTSNVTPLILLASYSL